MREKQRLFETDLVDGDEASRTSEHGGQSFCSSVTGHRPRKATRLLTKRRHRRRVRRGLDRLQRAGRRSRRSASPHRRRRRASRRRYRVGDRAKYRCSQTRSRRKSCGGFSPCQRARFRDRHEWLGDSRARREDRGDERIGRRREGVLALRVELSKVAFD